MLYTLKRACNYAKKVAAIALPEIEAMQFYFVQRLLWLSRDNLGFYDITYGNGELR